VFLKAGPAAYYTPAYISGGFRSCPGPICIIVIEF
jgi:hypothetical protein